MTIEQLIEMKAVGVTPEYIETIRKLGYNDLTAKQATELRAVGVDEEFIVSPDGAIVGAIDRARKLTLYPVDGSEPRVLADERGIPIDWSSDGKWLYLATMKSFRAHIYRRELATGRVESWRELALADPAGVFSMGGIYLSADGQAYAYNYARALNILYLVEGIK